MPNSAPSQSSAPAEGQTPAAPQGKAPDATNKPNVGQTQSTQPAEPQKPIDPIEAELAQKYGEKWTAVPEEMRAQIVGAERKSRDADKRYQSVAKLQKDHELTQRQAGQLLDLLVNDPEQVFTNPALMKRLNRDKLTSFAERIVWENLQNERMDPKDRELAELRKFHEETVNERKEREESERKTTEEAQLSEQIKERRVYWEREIIGALKAEGVEADNAFVAQVARYIQACKRVQKPVDLPQIIKQVQSDFNTWQNRYLMAGFKARQEGESNEAFAQRYESWVSRLDPKLVEAIRSGDLAKLKNKTMGRPAAPQRSEPRKESTEKISMSEWLEKRQERLGRK
jgi:hypothetical protein